jgi:phytanoyl-CoA hydroxylase
MDAPQARLQALADAFHRDGFVVVPGLCPDSVCADLLARVEGALHPLLAPAEFEADVGYPGAPSDREAEGGDTPRRLLHAYSRFEALRPWITGPAVKQHLQALLKAEAVALSQCHHNCIMTKYPGYSSDTLWHQDVRYWAFERPELVSLWLALGEERAENGALQVIPGSHRQAYSAEQLDEALFLRPDLPENRVLIDRAVTVQLGRGDVLFFHCRTFHAAGRNRTRNVKLSGVFTYHDQLNQAVPGTKSAQYPSIPL